MNAIVNQAVLESSLSARARFGLEAIGIAISRYGLVPQFLIKDVVLLGTSFLTASEALGNRRS
jgi:hypothetical protein